MMSKIVVNGKVCLIGFSIASTVLYFVIGLIVNFDIKRNVEVAGIQLLSILILALSTAFFEEILLRYGLLRGLIKITKRTGLPVIISSLVFALLHIGNSHVTALAILSHFFGGLVYGAYVTFRIC